MSENYNPIEEMQRAAEMMGGHEEKGDRAKVRRAVGNVMAQLGIRERIEDVRRDNHSWQIHFEGRLDEGTRQVVAGLAAEMLDISPERIRLIGFYPRK